MGQDILEQLYYGKIVPWENNNDQSPRSQELRDLIDKDIHSLSDMLSDEGRSMLERFLGNRSELADLAVCGTFKDGFRLRAQFTMDTFHSSKHP